jgi:hypothetical protein
MFRNRGIRAEEQGCIVERNERSADRTADDALRKAQTDSGTILLAW